MSWRDRAGCADYPTLEDFFDFDKTPGTARALLVCEVCPVRVECLEWALDNHERHGVLGGKTALQRSRMRPGQPWSKAAPKPPVEPHGTMAAYRRHYRQGTKPCGACVDANVAYMASSGRPRACPWCGAEFRASDRTQRFCGKSCAIGARRKRGVMSGWMTSTCQVCGKPARCRIMPAGVGCWLHLTRSAHAAKAADEDEHRRLELDRTLLEAPKAGA